MKNNIYKRISYQSTELEPLILNEYILFQENNTQNKFVLLNLFNNERETIYGMEFEVTQFNREGKPIIRADYVYEDFEAGGNKHFVPFGKIKVNENCESIELKLISALFRSKKWINGEWVWLENNSDQNISSDEITQINNLSDNKTFISTRLTKRGLYFPFHISILLIVLFIAISILSFSLYYSNILQYNDGEFSYEELSDRSVIIYDYHGISKNVVIPSHIKGKAVKEIASNAFNDDVITSVTINASNIRISPYAFANCSKLEKVTGRDVMEIDTYAFKDCINLQKVEFSKIELILGKAFYGCKKLETFTNNSFVKVDAYAFEKCDGLTYVYLPNSTISKRAFYGNKKMKELYFQANDISRLGDLFGSSNADVPESLKLVSFKKSYISKQFFAGLKQIEIIDIKDMSSVIIEYGALKDCSLKNYYLTKDMEILDNTLISTAPGITEIYISHIINDISTNAFANSGITLNRLEIHSSSSIHLTEEHFRNFSSLQYLVLNSNVTAVPGVFAPIKDTLVYVEMPVIGNTFKELFNYQDSSVVAVTIIGNGTMPKDYFINCDSIIININEN